MSSVYYLYPTSTLPFENEGTSYSSYGTGVMSDVFGSFDDETGGVARTDTFPPGAMKRCLWDLADFLPITTGIASVVVGARMWNVNGGWFDGALYVRVASINYSYFFVGGSSSGYTNYENTWTLNPNTSAVWTVAELNALIAGFGFASRGGTKTYKTTANYVRVAYAGAPALAPQARDVASRRVFDLGANKALVTQALPLETGKLINVMDDLPVVHWAGPHDSAAGWQPKLWEARLTKVYSMSIDPNTSSVSVQLRDRRPALCLLQDSGWSLKSSSAEGLGISRFDKGCTRTSVRTGDAYVLAPGSLRVTKVLQGVEMYGSVGQMHQRGQVQAEVIQNGFKNGAANVYTGWAQAIGSGGATIVDELEDHVWDAPTTGVLRSVKITAGTPLGATVTRLQSTATISFAANTKLRFSGWHRDLVPSIGAWWGVIRNIDTNMWRDSDSTWVVGGVGTFTYNQTPYSADWARFTSKEIDVGAGATTIVVECGVGGTNFATPGTALQSNLWSHMQLERDLVAPTVAGTWVSGEILTETTVLNRNDSVLTISNNSGKRCWNAAQGAFACEVIPQWTSAQLGNKNATIASVFHDASNWEWIYYDGTNDRWVFERRVAGSTQRAVKSATLVAGTVYLVGARWTGSNAELNLTAFTASIFIDGVKGTDVVTSAAPTEVTTVNLQIGSREGTDHFNGVVRLVHSFQWVPTDAEMARLPA